jgi:cytochrome c-type biogenesis protein
MPSPVSTACAAANRSVTLYFVIKTAPFLLVVSNFWGAVQYGAALLFIYALGRGVPIIIAGTFTGVVKRLLQWGRWSVWIEKASGLIIILVGFYFIWIA